MSRVAVVTGANQGLGLALVTGLSQRLEAGDVVYLTGRDPARVETAAEQVTGARADVQTRVVDVSDTATVEDFANELAARHGGVDIVFSNAYQRVMPDDDPAAVVDRYVDINNLGTTRMLRAFGPILRPGGRLLVVASTLGTLSQLPPHLHERFDTAAMTLDDVDRVMLAWRDAVIEGRAGDEGWPDWINVPSKVGQVAAVRVWARHHAAAGQHDGTLVAALCPGLIDTEASNPWLEVEEQLLGPLPTPQSPAEAAKAPLRLALDPEVDGRFYGELVRYGQVLPWR